MSVEILKQMKNFKKGFSFNSGYLTTIGSKIKPILNAVLNFWFLVGIHSLRSKQKTEPLRVVLMYIKNTN